MKKILVPTDFSKASLNTYEYALRLGHKLGAKVTLFHVYGQDGSQEDMPVSLAETLEAKDEEGALLALEGYGYAVQRSIDVEVSSAYILDPGRPVNAIVEYADFMEADLIVMSTWWSKGVSGIVDTWLGHAGTKVLEQSNRPVLLIPEGVKYKELHHIAYATNFREKDQRIPTELIDLSNAFDLDLSCLHVKRPNTSYNEIEYAFLKEMYRLELDNFNIYFYTITDDNVIGGLNMFVEKENVELLAMINHERLTVFDRILGPSIPYQMAFHTKIPLLVLNQAYEPQVPPGSGS